MKDVQTPPRVPGAAQRQEREPSFAPTVEWRLDRRVRRAVHVSHRGSSSAQHAAHRLAVRSLDVILLPPQVGPPTGVS